MFLKIFGTGFIFLLVFSSVQASANEISSSSIEFGGGTALEFIEAGSKESLNRQLRHEAKLGRISRIEKLIREGADVNAAAEYGETALYYAILFGRVKAALRLIELGANPNSKDDMDHTPLLKAAEDCNFRVVDALLKAGADVNHADYFGRTALINASESNCIRAVAVILTRAKGRVQIEAEDNYFHNARDYAQHPWVQQMLDLATGKITAESVTLPNLKLP